MPRWTEATDYKAPEGKHERRNRICRTCNRPISEHRQKVFGNWVCNLALLDNGHWVHESRLPVEGRKVVHKLSETFG